MRRFIWGTVRFMRGVWASPMGVRIWLAGLVVLNFVVPAVFFLSRLEARVVIGAFLVGAALMFALTAIQGFTRLLGLGHVFWIPLVIYLIGRAAEYEASDAYGLWIRLVALVDAISVVIDAVDVTRWVRGDRGEMAVIPSDRP